MCFHSYIWRIGLVGSEAVVENGQPKIIRHPALKHVKANVGTILNKALESIEDANPDALQDVLKGID
jgi:type I restriction enzyme M protein